MKLMPENKNTQRTAVISAVNACKGRKGFGKALKFYTDKMENLNNELRDSTGKTERYKENEMEWSEIIKARDALPKNSVEYVVMCLYTMIPPRRNLDMILKIGTPEPNGNWYDPEHSIFSFGNYKTAEKYHTQIVPVPSDLKNVIDNYLNIRPFKSNDLLIKKSGLPFKTRDIQLTINKVLGKRIGCTMLRGLFLSSKYGPMMDQLKHDTEAMATSQAVATSNYIRT